MNRETTAYRIIVRGLVQGVGFRPFVYRLATRLGYKGWVENRTDGVVILLEENDTPVKLFTDALIEEAPQASDIESVVVEIINSQPSNIFSISHSKESEHGITEISPDIAVCNDCLRDLKTQAHRKNYPLINCIHCGPRFSIIKSLPYDRPNTTMAPFSMCPLCEAEYKNILNRRFHAQPVACNHCGPVYSILHNDNVILRGDIEGILFDINKKIENGETLALKGIGGYHLICDALNPKAIERLRTAKKRDGKPFAVMFKDIKTLKRFAKTSIKEIDMLSSWRRPIMLLDSKNLLPSAIGNDLRTIGAVLPYMPIHYLLFEVLATPALVFTSGNIAEIPVEIDDFNAQKNLEPVTELIVCNDREIYNRADDSVIRMINNQLVMIRRSRGYVPKPIHLGLCVEGILGAGPELKNTFCIGKENQAIVSQHIGDLKNHETYCFYTETIERFRNLFHFEPDLIATDLHPDYLSTQYAYSQKVPLISVQHHHAHIASCMAEHLLDEPVIGLAFDGTGLGDDGNIWGSEIMIATLKDYSRFMHMEYIALPGGDKSIVEPWRIATAVLHRYFGNEGIHHAIRLFPNIKSDKLLSVVEAVEKNININYSCGLGRIFDVVAAITNLCIRETFEAEGPMRLESITDKKVIESYPVVLDQVLYIEPIVRSLLRDTFDHVPVAVISARFHNTIAEYAVSGAKHARKETGISSVVLSGGSFQNKFLTEKIIKGLLKLNFTVYMQTQVPPNDGGISLGQLAVAAKRRSLSCV